MIRFLQTPSPVKHLVLGFILVAFCLIMVISLVPSTSQQLGGSVQPQRSGSGPAAEEVTVEQVQQRASALAERMQYPPQLVPFLMGRALEGMIAEKAQLCGGRSPRTEGHE